MMNGDARRRRRLPVPVREDPIVEDLLRVILAMNRDHDGLGPLFSPATNRRLSNDGLMMNLQTYDGRQNMVDAAEAGWGTAQEILLAVISELDSRGLPIPLELQNYRLKLYTGRVPPPMTLRGPDKRDRAYNDLLIAFLVNHACQHHGLVPYGRGGAIAKVAEALTLAAIGMARGEDAVKRAHKRWGQFARECGLNLDIFEGPMT